jgi:polar amino acid transport system substrate-binding protein
VSASGSAGGAFDLNSIQADPALKAMLPSGMTQIRVASDIPYPPWEYFDPPSSKNPAGFDYDLSQALGKKIGVPVSFNTVPFDSIILNVKARKNDMIMSDMYDNAERQQQGFTFVDYAYDGTSILVKKGNPEGMTEIRVASDIPYPPWEFFDPPNSSDPAGFDYDLSQALGKKIGVPVSFNDVPFDGIILNIKGGRNDMIMSAMYDNAERQAEGISFVDYAYDGTSILTLKGNPEGLTNLDSLAGKTVACQQGTTQQALLQRLNRQFREEGMEPMNVLTLPDQPAALLAVSSGRAVADVTDHSTAAYIAQTTNDGNTFEVIEDPEAPQGYEPAIIGIGIVEENQELIDTVQQALQALIDDGVYQQLIESYGLLPVESAEVNLGGQTPLPLPSE